MDEFCNAQPKRQAYRAEIEKNAWGYGGSAVIRACLVLYLSSASEPRYKELATKLESKLDAYLKKHGKDLYEAGLTPVCFGGNAHEKLIKAQDKLTAAMGRDALAERLLNALVPALIWALEVKGYPLAYESLVKALNPFAVGPYAAMTATVDGVLDTGDALPGLMDGAPL